MAHTREPFATIRAPASAANLGSGFDVLGLALDLDLRIEVRWAPPQGKPRIHRSGELSALRTDRDLIWLGAETLAREFGRELPPLELTAHSPIPISRGLGSSAAALSAGLLVGCAALEIEPDALTLLRLGTPVEGHAENLAAALLGGLISVSPVKGNDTSVPTSTQRHALHEGLRFVVAWPDVPIETAAARRALPDHVPHALVARQNGRLLRLLRGLSTGAAEDLRRGMEDELHVPYRLPLIPGGARALEEAEAAGALSATISGSGSTLLAVIPANTVPERIGEAMVRAMEAHGARATFRVCEPGHGAGLL